MGVQYRTPRHDVPPHIVTPLHVRFKGKRGERYHMLPLSETKNPGVNIQQVINLLIEVQRDTNSPQVNWSFFGKEAEDVLFEKINYVIIKRINIIKNDDVRENKMKLKYIAIREEYSINRSFHRGNSTHSQNRNIPELVL